MMGFALEKVTTDFTSQILGKLDSPVATGSFGEVYRCTVKSSIGKTEVAVKVFKIDPGRSMDKLTNAMLRELKVWLKLEHLHIVPLHGTAQIDSPLLALVSEWMSSGKLADYLSEQATTITPAARIKLAEGIVKGLRYLHSKNVIHGDLHPGNVLINGSGNPCLTDFGLATVAEDSELHWARVTMARKFDARWHAPEVIGIDADPKRPTSRSDIYSFGSVVFFIVSGDAPWKEKKHSFQICIELSKQTTPTRPDNIHNSHWDLIQKCWSWKPEDRPDATRVLQIIEKHWWGTPTKSIVLFGQTGSGKSSVVNLMAGEEVAKTSSGHERCTLHWKKYYINFDGHNYKVFDTMGLEEQEFRPIEYLEAIENAYNLVAKLASEGSIDLLLFCVRAGRITTTTWANHRLFYEWLCEKKIPIVLIVTGLERERNMEDWWDRNKVHLSRYDIRVAGHACITAFKGAGKERYEESARLVRDLVTRHSRGMREAGANRSVIQNLSGSILGNFYSTLKKKDVVTILTKRCGMLPEAAEELASRIKSRELP